MKIISLKNDTGGIIPPAVCSVKKYRKGYFYLPEPVGIRFHIEFHRFMTIPFSLTRILFAWIYFRVFVEYPPQTWSLWRICFNGRAVSLSGASSIRMEFVTSPLFRSGARLWVML